MNFNSYKNLLNRKQEKKSLFSIFKNKRTIYLTSVIVLILLTVILNYTFSAFTNSTLKEAANIKVNDMNYSIKINGSPGTIITAPNNKDTASNLIITSLNEIESKYEIIYKVCTDIACNNVITKPDNLEVEYSSKTIDPITGAILSDGSKVIRVVVLNNTNTTYYIQIGINAGYSHNTLALQNLIINEYNEEDVTIAAYIEGELSTSFPTTSSYSATVSCTVNNQPTTATGSATWDGSKWVVSVSNVTTGKTVCNVNFATIKYLKDTILAQGGGATAISAKGNPNFVAIATEADTGLFASADEYGTSYYYRGLKANLKNNLIFAGFQWKIVRINGDGSIRIIYNGKCPNNTCTINNTHADTDLGATSILNTGTDYTHAWNTTNYNDNKYVGYMYGGANGSASGTKTVAQTNTTATNAKTVLDAWYVSSIVSQGTNIISKIVDNIFCNDRQTSTVTTSLDNGGGYAAVNTYYGAYYRLITNKIPTLKCINKNDRFTVSDTTLGNGALTYPVGLITADEASMAGLVSGTSNSTNYLYTAQTYWTFSPYRFTGGFANLFRVYSAGSLGSGVVDSANGLRPLLNLKSDTTITSGDGSPGNPFVLSS